MALISLRYSRHLSLSSRRIDRSRTHKAIASCNKRKRSPSSTTIQFERACALEQRRRTLDEGICSQLRRAITGPYGSKSPVGRYVFMRRKRQSSTVFADLFQLSSVRRRFAEALVGASRTYGSNDSEASPSFHSTRSLRHAEVHSSTGQLYHAFRWSSRDFELIMSAHEQIEPVFCTWAVGP